MKTSNMTCTWLHRHGSPVCVVFFAGWGMDSRPFAPLAAGGVDVCMLSQYRNTWPLTLPELQTYEDVILVAWSFGVWMATQVCTWPLRALCSEMIALGGTLKPVDERQGLAPQQFEAVLADFDENRLVAFYRTMFDEEDEAACFLRNRPHRTLADLREELVFLHQASRDAPVALDMFSHHVVTSRDRIFAGRNQLRAWGKESTHTVPWPHFPFYRFTSWGELLNALLADR